jgi:endonuclease YncB( thermonuclease family)
MRRHLALLLLTVFCSVLSAKANTLYGRVVEIHDGKNMTVENTGRRIKVALKAADAPEMDQPYGLVARQHLSTLTLNQQVTIEYTGLGPGGLLIARVFCGDRDIGLQMIRDGVAWFDPAYENELGAADRQVYADSEQAARNEHRGIWQDPSPTPPWEWRQASANKSGRRSGAVAYSDRRPSMTNEVSIGKASSSYSTLSPTATPSGRTDIPQWPLFSPSENPFSVRIPGGKQFTVELDIPHSQPVILNFYVVHHLKIGYVVGWASGPLQDQTISKIFDRGLEELNRIAEAIGLPCDFSEAKDVPMSSYTGRRYKVRGCYLNGSMRAYYKIEGKTLKARVAGVMSEIPDDPEVGKFLESFVIHN